MKRKFIAKTTQIKESAVSFIKSLPIGPVYEIMVKECKDIRTLEQNSKMWAMLTDISKQVEWYGNWLTPEDWKCVFTAALKRETKVVPNLDGDGFVAIGLYTSKMSTKKMRDLIELMYAFGTSKQVRWSTPKKYCTVA